MLSFLKTRLRLFYDRKIRKLSDVDITIERMRRNGITVGERCRIFCCISSTEPYLITIGNQVTISGNVHFITHDNGIIKVLEGRTDVVGPITVGDRCFIGMNSTLLPGVTLGENCIVGAGSVVTRSFPPHTVLAGNPARAICTTEQYAAKYADRAFDFSSMPPAQREAHIKAHPEFWIKR